MVDQYFAGNFQHFVSNASIVDLTPPSFSGISSATANSNGSITASWATATDASSPITYLIYIALGSVSAASLFVPANLVTIAPSLATSTKVYTLADQTTYLLANQIYTLGVRASDVVGNANTNTAIATATSSGVLSDSLSATVSQLVATTARLDGYTSTLGTTTSTLGTTTSTLGTTTSTLGVTATRLDGYTSTLGTTTSTLGTTTSTLGTTTSTLGTTTSTLGATATRLDSDVTALDGYLSTLDTSVTDIEKAATSVNNAANLAMSVIL